jgi:cell volume regulation protein A
VRPEEAIETLAIVLAAGLLAEFLARLVRLPRMIFLLAAGVAVGPSALGFVALPLDSVGVQILLSLGVSFILFYGGLEISVKVLTRVGVGLGLLAVPGVIVTACVVGASATIAFDVPFEAGFLIGAVLAPTDPAILIPLFERLRVRPKLVQTIIAESALNDATAAVLALSVAAFVLDGQGSLAEPLGDFVVELAVSIALGLGFGVLLALVLSTRRFGIWRESPAVALMALVAAGYVTISTAGGSGYMGAFIAGVVAGNARLLGLGAADRHERELELFSARVTDIVVLLVFIAVGANLPLDTIAENALPALAVIGVLVLVARPLTVAVCLLPDRRGSWRRNELVYMASARETGVVPVSVAGILFVEGVPYEDEIVTVVAVAIVFTLLVLSTSKAWLARRLDLVEPPRRSFEPPE